MNINQYIKDGDAKTDEFLKLVAASVNESGDGDMAKVLICTAIERLTSALGSSMQSVELMSMEDGNPEVFYKTAILPRLLPAFRRGTEAAKLDPSIYPVKVN